MAKTKKDEEKELPQESYFDLDNFSLFEPKTNTEINDLRIDYPELGEEPAFKELKPRELRFVWLYANRTSPVFKQYHTLPKKERAKVCVEIVYGKKFYLRKEAQSLYDSDFSPHIMKAIERMAQYQPSIRLRARLMNEYIYDNLQSIILVSQVEMKAMGPDDRKKYASLILEISKELPTVVNNIERGFGIVLKKKEDRTKLPTASIKDITNELD